MRTSLAAAGLGLVLALTGCGSDSDTGDEPASEPTAESSPSRGAGMGGFDQAALQEIQECLEAAGLDVELPQGMPSGMPSDLPSDFDPDNPPSDFDPENPPEGFPSDGAGPGGGLGALQDPEVQAALQACGIELPERPGPGSGADSE